MAFFMNTFKYSIFIVNLIFFALGIYLSYEAYSQLGNEVFNLDSALKSPIYFTFVIAIIVVLISFLGCCGISQESPCMIKSYAGFILLCILLQVAAIVMIARTDPEQVANQIKKNVFSKFDAQSKSVQRTIQIFQDSNKCCAINNWKDYGDDTTKVPNSCCNEYNENDKDQFGKCTRETLDNVVGCKVKFINMVHENYKSVYIVVGCILGFQVLVVILSCVLSKSIRDQYNVV